LSPSHLNPADVVIIDAVRTPFGRHGGALSSVRPDDLGAVPIRALLERTGIDPQQIEDVVYGCANQAGEDNRNVARMAALLAGLPQTVAATTVNRLCGSSLDALQHAARMLALGDGEFAIAGGVESMSRAPWSMPKPDQAFPRGHAQLWDTTLGWRYPNPRLEAMFPLESMGETAENIYAATEIARERQDAFALRSHQLAVAGAADGKFDAQLVPVEVPLPRGQSAIVDRDEGPRPDASLEKLATLRPVFRERGVVTAGNSSGLNDGAAALLLGRADAALAAGLRPMARVVASAVAGVDPRTMGMGPVPASQKALARAGLSVDALDIIELNEAFAVQALAVIDALGLPEERVNVNGGAIALGHPLGASGARIAGAVVHELARSGGRYGLATMCIGVGQGIATIFERVG
jgi:acetyl-CoA C-acetyltransferase